MFADNSDTYLYNNQTGEVYIRYKQGGLNYKDVFVRMPNGVIPDGAGMPSLPKSSIPKPNTQQNSIAPTSTNDMTNAKKMLEEATRQMGNLLYEGGE